MIDIDRRSYVDGDAASGMRYRFVGLSTETKPTSSSTPALAAGCEFYEQDTNRYFYFDGLSWRIRPPATLDDLLSAINALNETQTKCTRGTFRAPPWNDGSRHLQGSRVAGHDLC
jgi:hypothetical protein